MLIALGFTLRVLGGSQPPGPPSRYRKAFFFPRFEVLHFQLLISRVCRHRLGAAQSPLFQQMGLSALGPDELLLSRG